MGDFELFMTCFDSLSSQYKLLANWFRFYVDESNWLSKMGPQKYFTGILEFNRYNGMNQNTKHL